MENNRNNSNHPWAEHILAETVKHYIYSFLGGIIHLIIVLTSEGTLLQFIAGEVELAGARFLLKVVLFLEKAGNV